MPINTNTCRICGKLYNRDFSKGLAGCEFCSPECTQIWNNRYENHPFTKIIAIGKIEVTNNFLIAAVPFSDLSIDDILKIFEIERTYLDEARVPTILNSIKKKKRNTLSYYRDAERLCKNQTALRIMLRRMTVMEQIVDDLLNKVGMLTKEMKPHERKMLCLLVNQIVRDPCGHYTQSYMCNLLQICPNSYYRYVHDEKYGMAIRKRDLRYLHIVREAFWYKGYPKGVRMVYMLIPRLFGIKIGLDRVRRIMREFDMDCSVRKPNDAKAQAEKTLKARRKPNLLRRMFRLHRPNEVRLTDVTVIQCYNGTKFYGAALMDPVTGVLIAFEVSDHNDLELVKEILRKSDSHPCAEGGIIHSDQGTVYLSPEFQQEVERLGFRQSMSKRGNCWDNSPQESFFGHFKDECKDKYNICSTLEELRAVINDYVYYYNNERGMWERNHMTPVEYEAYLLSLSDEEFAAYMDREMSKYIEMKEEAQRKAIERARSLGVDGIRSRDDE